MIHKNIEGALSSVELINALQGELNGALGEKNTIWPVWQRFQTELQQEQKDFNQIAVLTLRLIQLYALAGFEEDALAIAHYGFRVKFLPTTPAENNLAEVLVSISKKLFPLYDGTSEKDKLFEEIAQKLIKQEQEQCARLPIQKNSEAAEHNDSIRRLFGQLFPGGVDTSGNKLPNNILFKQSLGRYLNARHQMIFGRFSSSLMNTEQIIDLLSLISITHNVKIKQDAAKLLNSEHILQFLKAEFPTIANPLVPLEEKKKILELVFKALSGTQTFLDWTILFLQLRRAGNIEALDILIGVYKEKKNTENTEALKRSTDIDQTEVLRMPPPWVQQIQQLKEKNTIKQWQRVIKNFRDLLMRAIQAIDEAGFPDGQVTMQLSDTYWEVLSAKYRKVLGTIQQTIEAVDIKNWDENAWCLLDNEQGEIAARWDNAYPNSGFHSVATYNREEKIAAMHKLLTNFRKLFDNWNQQFTKMQQTLISPSYALVDSWIISDFLKGQLKKNMPKFPSANVVEIVENLLPSDEHATFFSSPVTPEKSFLLIRAKIYQTLLLERYNTTDVFSHMNTLYQIYLNHKSSDNIDNWLVAHYALLSCVEFLSDTRISSYLEIQFPTAEKGAFSCKVPAVNPTKDSARAKTNQENLQRWLNEQEVQNTMKLVITDRQQCWVRDMQKLLDEHKITLESTMVLREPKVSEAVAGLQ